MTLQYLLFRLRRKLGYSAFYGQGNVVKAGSSLRGCKMTVEGNNNKIIIGPGVKFNHATIHIYGDGNTLTIGSGTRLLSGAGIYISKAGSVKIGEKSVVRSCDIESQYESVSIGSRCMFSVNVEIRNNDGHRIYNIEDERLVNPPASVEISDDVWLGKGVTIMKGVKIGRGAVIGRGSLVTKDCPARAVMAGVPARVVKTGIRWER